MNTDATDPNKITNIVSEEVIVQFVMYLFYTRYLSK